MAQWLKNLTGCLCILTLLMHLVPNKKFSRYVRFYGGLLFFLVAAGPIWNLFAGEGELERVLQLSFLKEDYYDLESSVAGMAELKNDRIMDAYRSEIMRQIRETGAAYGLVISDVGLSFDEDDAYRLTEISFTVDSLTAQDLPGSKLSKDAEQEKDMGQDLSGNALYGKTTGQESWTEPVQENAVEEVRREIAGVYALELNRIHVRGEETKR